MEKRGVNEWENAYGNLGMVIQPRLMQLPLAALDPWHGEDGEQQPFKPYTTEKLTELADNIRENGVIESIKVRPKQNGRFEILAGHNRCAAAKLAGLTAIPAIVEQMNDARAAQVLVDSNLQHRERLLPSEKAFAYKLRLDSLKRQGQRSDLTSDQLGPKLAVESIGAGSDSPSQVKRYIRLTHLTTPLLDLVDEGKFKLTAAVEVSYLAPVEQEQLYQIMQNEKIKPPSLAQAQQLHRLSQEQQITSDTIYSALFPAKAPKPAAIKLIEERISSFFPPNTSAEQMEAEIYAALLAYRKENAAC